MSSDLEISTFSNDKRLMSNGYLGSTTVTSVVLASTFSWQDLIGHIITELCLFSVLNQILVAHCSLSVHTL